MILEQTPVIRGLGLDDDSEQNLITRADFNDAGIKNFEFYTEPDDFFKDFNDNVYVAIVDHFLKGNSYLGFAVVEEINKRVEESASRMAGCLIIIISGQRRYDVLKAYNRMGVFDYIDKDEPDYSQRLISSTRLAMEKQQKWIWYLNKWNGGVLNAL